MVENATKDDIYNGQALLDACESKSGGDWFCLTHNKGFANNIEKDDHISRGSHKMAWMCREHGPEVP